MESAHQTFPKSDVPSDVLTWSKSLRGRGLLSRPRNHPGLPSVAATRAARHLGTKCDTISYSVARCHLDAPLWGQTSISQRDGRAFACYEKLQCVPSTLHISPPLRYSSDLDEITAALEPSLLAGCASHSSTSSPTSCIAQSTFSPADGCFSHLGLKMGPRPDRSLPLSGYNFQNGLT